MFSEKIVEYGYAPVQHGDDDAKLVYSLPRGEEGKLDTKGGADQERKTQTGGVVITSAQVWPMECPAEGHVEKRRNRQAWSPGCQVLFGCKIFSCCSIPEFLIA
jgi:hypothetical protein